MNSSANYYGKNQTRPHDILRARLHRHTGLDHLILVGMGLCLIYSWALVLRYPLSSIPSVAYLPVFGFVVGCMLYNYKTFLVGWMLAGVLSSIGTDFEVQLGVGQLATRDMVQNFGAFNLGFVNLGLANSALVLSGLFVARYYLGRVERTFRIFFIPAILLAFSFFQFLLYPHLATITLTNRTIIVGVFLIVAIRYLRWQPDELVKMTKWTVALLTLLCLFYFLNILGSKGGRAMWAFVLAAIPISIYLIKLRKFWAYIAVVPLLLCSIHAVAFATYWFKLLVFTSIASVVLVPIIQRNRFIFFIFPIISILLPLSSLFVEPPDDMGGYARQLMNVVEEGSTIGNLAVFNFQEVWDLVQYKYRVERAGLWQSSLRHTFNPVGMNTIFPDPSVHFLLYTKTGSVGMWFNGPHNGFLFLLRAYGLVAGLMIFGLLNYWIYQVIIAPYPGGPMRWIYQPFLLGFAIIGFSIGDYPLTSGSYLLIAIVGLAMAYLRNFPPLGSRR